jgi:protein farnesyltransferase subunit beta
MAASSSLGVNSPVPDHFLRPPLLHDDEVTQTSEAQQETVEECLPLLGAFTDPARNPFDFNEYGVPELKREDHVDFCLENLAQFPAQFVGLDASRPWLVYWGSLSLHLLGEDITPMRQRYLIFAPFFDIL